VQVVFGRFADGERRAELLLDRDVDVNQRHGVETQILVEPAAGKDLLRREAQSAGERRRDGLLDLSLSRPVVVYCNAIVHIHLVRVSGCRRASANGIQR
jgi:hypothetical protein